MAHRRQELRFGEIGAIGVFLGLIERRLVADGSLTSRTMLTISVAPVSGSRDRFRLASTQM